jgi:imidazoleglycerol-phosphate dehydratase
MTNEDSAPFRRRAEVERKTSETNIRLALDLDGGERRLATPDGFFSHMLDALGKHGGLGLDVSVQGDTHIDLHHSVEDTGIVLGEALSRALGERRGIVRFAYAYAPLDEALARAVIDISGRGFLDFGCPEELRQVWIKPTFPLSLLADFFGAFADRGRFTLHLEILKGRNGHHAAEAAFKAVALALRQAIARRGDEIPSTKGTLNS